MTLNDLEGNYLKRVYILD